MTEPKKYPRLFDSSKLTESQKKLLSDFSERRKKFDQFIADNYLKLFTCPCCGYPTLPKRHTYHICKLCRWEDDDQDDPDADEIWGGPNYSYSLTEYRLEFCEEMQKVGITPEEAITLSTDEVLQRLCAHKRNWRKDKRRRKPS